MLFHCCLPYRRFAARWWTAAHARSSKSTGRRALQSHGLVAALSKSHISHETLLVEPTCAQSTAKIGNMWKHWKLSHGRSQGGTDKRRMSHSTAPKTSDDPRVERQRTPPPRKFPNGARLNWVPAYSHGASSKCVITRNFDPEVSAQGVCRVSALCPVRKV